VLTISRSLPRLLRAAAVLGSSLILAASTVAQAKDKVILQLDWLASGEKSAPYAGKALNRLGLRLVLPLLFL
jgi:ABC-type nitrate/sulfonate/bicarbonate transport system substrate-binding protein